MNKRLLSVLLLNLLITGSSCVHDHEVHDDTATDLGHDHDSDLQRSDLTKVVDPHITLEFVARVGNQIAQCGTKYAEVGKGGTASIELNDLRFYIHDLRLVDDTGLEVPIDLTPDQKWQYQNVALLDFEDKSGACTGTVERNTQIKGMVPDGSRHWQGVRFRVGVPFALNHADVSTAPSPLNLSSMFWTWQSGYKFVRIEGDTGTGGSFIVHLGSTGCMKDGSGKVVSCQSPNRPEVALTGFDPLANKITVDVGALLAESNLASPMGTECMSGPGNSDCAPIFSQLGLPYGAAPASSQKIFRFE